jgi:hypothetical protein
VQTGLPSQLDPILAAAHHFHGLDIVTVTFDLHKKLNDKRKVCKVPCRWASGPKSWREVNLGNCLQEFAKPGRNSIVIVTETSDIYALDVDVKDGGFEALERMLKEHGDFLENTPRLNTGNGGLHILFSLSQSEQAGLLNCNNRARIRYKGKAVGIDVRGRGGMLYTAPISYVGLDGTLRRYMWDREILPERSNLRAVPDWLLSILNDGDEGPSGGVEVTQEGDKARYVFQAASMLHMLKLPLLFWSPRFEQGLSKLSKLSKLWIKFFRSGFSDVIKPL